MKRSLNRKEKNFCYHLVETGNPYEAFKISKMQNEGENIPKLMLDESVREEISRICEKKFKNSLAKSEIGYERLAFGRIFDCIKLMFMKDIEDCQIENMNLFNISEIKRLKDGTIEIKFFDRMKALEKLEQIESAKSNSQVLPFYSALENGMKKLANEN